MKTTLTLISQKFWVLILGFMLMSLQTGFGQGKGIFHGTVIDKKLQLPLPGATIKVEGWQFATASDLSGKFDLKLNPGSYTLQITYIGYEPQSVAVQIDAGQTISKDIILKSKVLKTGEIIVIGQLKGQAKALNQQRSSSTIKNIVAADQISRFPDPNVAEALQRVPGVNVERDEGEGRYVFVRGLSPQYTNISINGEQIPSPEGGVRYMALDAIPSDQLASMEVTKALTPDMDGDAIGGNVNLISRTAESQDLKVNALIAGEYTNLNADFGYQSALDVSQRIMDGKFGYMLNLSYHPSHRGSHKNEMDDWDIGGNTELQTFELRDYNIERNRVGVSTTLDYQFDPSNMVYLRGLYSDLREHENRRRLIFEYDEDDDEWKVGKNMKSRPENQGVYNLNFGGRHALESFNLDYEASYSYARQETPHDRRAKFETGGMDAGSIDISDPLVPKVSLTLDGDDFCWCDQNSEFEFDEYEESETMATDQNITTKFNLTYPVQFGSTPGKIKFGAKLRFKNKDYDVSSYDEWGYEGSEDLTLDKFLGDYESDDFGDGDYKTGKFPSVKKFRDFFLANTGDFENDPEKTLEEQTLENYDATENVYAGYLMGEFQLSKNSMILGGVRYEFTDVDYTGGQWDADNDAAVKVAGQNDYSFFLPMLHLKYSVDKYTSIRAAATLSYARPNFEEMVQGAEFDLDDKEANLGNLNLEPVKAFNLDLFGEHYFGNVGVLSAGVFYKSLNDFIYKRTFNSTFRGVDDVEITQSVNGDDASLWGIELAWQQNLTFLPGLLQGLGVYANYTYTNSSATVKELAGSDENESEIDLPGQAEHVGNFALYYTRGGFNARLSLNFNGEFIEEIDGDDLYKIDDRLQIDFSASQQINNNFSVYTEFINLTNQRRVDFYNTLDTPATREFYGFWTRFGFKYNL